MIVGFLGGYKEGWSGKGRANIPDFGKISIICLLAAVF
jgi:hypothetical protein